LSGRDEEEKDSPKATSGKCPRIRVKINGVETWGLIDTGSNVTVINNEWLEKIQKNMKELVKIPIRGTFVSGANGRIGRIKWGIFAKIGIQEININFPCFTLPKLSWDCIIGIDLIEALKGKIDIENKKIILMYGNTEVVCNFDDEPITPELIKCCAMINQLSYEKRYISEIESKIIGLKVSSSLKEEFKSILYSNEDIFTNYLGEIKGAEHYIKVIKDEPFYVKNFPIPVAIEKEVDVEIEKMIQLGIIEESHSKFISGLVPVKKKDGTVRICFDGRKINKMIEPDYLAPLPVNELLMKCGNAAVFSTLDLTSSYWQIPLNKESRKYVSFIYRDKTYSYRVCPFGLKTSQAALVRAVGNIIGEARSFTLYYVDDFLVYSSSVEEHIKHLRCVLSIFKKKQSYC